MKRYSIYFILVSLTITEISAQFVQIPNAKMAGYFRSNYTGCMNNDMLDTTCIDILNEKLLNISFGYDIDNLYGVQFFKSLETLNCSVNDLSTLPALPKTLKHLYCYGNRIVNLPILPDSLELLICFGNQLTELPTLPISLKTLNCMGNKLNSLPALPNRLTEIECSYNDLSEIDEIPSSLKILRCNNNNFTSLPTLPTSLITFICTSNKLVNLPDLPMGLLHLDCSSNKLSHLPKLSDSLRNLLCADNQIKCFPVIPNEIKIYDFSNNSHTCLPNHIVNFDSATRSQYPICLPNDSINNPNGCYDSTRITFIPKTETKSIYNIYPNPGKGVFIIKTPHPDENLNTLLEVYDFKGQLIYQTALTSEYSTIDISEYPSGLYHIHIKNEQSSFNQLIQKID